MFRNVIRSRRKKHKNRTTTTPVNIGGDGGSKRLYPDRVRSSYHHDFYAAKKQQQQQQQQPQQETTTDDDDGRGQSLPLHECSPSRTRTRTRSFDPPVGSSRDKELCDNPATPNESHGTRKKSFLKFPRRKSKHGGAHNNNNNNNNYNYTNTGYATPDTVSSGPHAPQQNQPSGSNHDRIRSSRDHDSRRSRGFNDYPHRSETYDEHSIAASSEDTLEIPTDLREPPDTRVAGVASPNNNPSRERMHRLASPPGGTEPESRRGNDSAPATPNAANLRVKRHNNNNNNNNSRNQTTTTNDSFRDAEQKVGKQSSRNTKTVIMNGDIVVSKSPHKTISKSSSDTLTVTSSASSNSKAKAMRRESERNARAASALDTKGNELFEKGYFDKAMACYTKALKLKRRTFAHLLEETDDFEEALILQDDINPADPEALVSMATSINNIGYLRQRSGDATPEETMAAYKKSLRIKRRILGNDSLSVGKTLNNIGSVHYLKRDFECALSAYDEALEIMKANLGDKHPDVATVMSNIGDVYLAQDNKETSVKYYRLALVIRWEAFGEHSPRVVRLLEKISNLEIGDMSSKNLANHRAHSDDNASDVMAGSDFQPVSEALKLLQLQVQSDIEQVDQMERNAAVETLKDKIIIIRGMRDVWNGSGPVLLDNDSESVQTAMSRLSGR